MRMKTNRLRKQRSKTVVLFAASLFAAAAAMADCRNDLHATARVGYIDLPNVPDLGQLKVLAGKEYDVVKDGRRWKFELNQGDKSFVILEQPIVIYSGETELWRAKGGDREPTPTGGCVAAYKVSAPLGSWFVRVSTAPRSARFDYAHHSKQAAPAMNAK